MFGPTAPQHDWVPAPRYLLRRARILALTRDLPSGELLEVGCGVGMLLHEFARRGFRCTALESSEAASRIARTLAHEAGLSIDFHEQPELGWARRFDAIFAFEVLEHIEDDRAALARWAEWVKPGGHVVLSVPAHTSLWSAGDEWAGHYRRYERDDVMRLVLDAGIELERLECYGYPAANLGERIAAASYARRLRRGLAGREPDRRAKTARSGIERGPHLRMYPLLTSWPGRLAIAAAVGIQRLFLGTDLGSGYIVRARKR